MFKSTGNNFGGPEITFKDYQDEHEIVLNAIFEYDSTNPAYRNATELEIHVPDLSLSKSAVAGCYFAAYGMKYAILKIRAKRVIMRRRRYNVSDSEL